MIPAKLAELGVLANISGKLRQHGGSLFPKRRRAERVRRVRPERRAQDRATSRQRPSRPPDMQRRNMPVPDRFLAPRMRRDRLHREIHFNQSFWVIHIFLPQRRRERRVFLCFVFLCVLCVSAVKHAVKNYKRFTMRLTPCVRIGTWKLIRRPTFRPLSFK